MAPAVAAACSSAPWTQQNVQPEPGVPRLLLLFEAVFNSLIYG